MDGWTDEHTRQINPAALLRGSAIRGGRAGSFGHVGGGGLSTASWFVFVIISILSLFSEGQEMEEESDTERK